MNNGVDSADMVLACVLLLVIGIFMVMMATDKVIIENKYMSRLLISIGIVFMAIPLLKLIVFVIFN